MSIGAALRNNPAVGIGIAIVVIALAAYTLMRPDPPRGNPGVYHYDLETGNIVAAERSASNGDAPVIAHVYTCGACKPDEWFIAWIGIDDEARDLRGVAPPPQQGAQPTWLPIAAPEAGALLDSVNNHCDGQPARPCLPQ